MLAAQVPAETPSTSPALTVEQTTLVRCSAAFAMIAYGQSNGNGEAQKWPDLGTRGREFFVRSLAQLMDELQLDRTQVEKLMSDAVQRLWDDGEIDAVMPGCLLMLEASGV